MEMLSVGLSEHFRDEYIFSRIPVEHIQRYSRVKSCNLQFKGNLKTVFEHMTLPDATQMQG